MSDIWNRHRAPEDDWREIKEFPNYMINRNWEVRSLRTGEIVTPAKNEFKLTVYLSKNGKQYHRGVRKLFREAFPEEK